MRNFAICFSFVVMLMSNGLGQMTIPSEYAVVLFAKAILVYTKTSEEIPERMRGSIWVIGETMKEIDALDGFEDPKVKKRLVMELDHQILEIFGGE